MQYNHRVRSALGIESSFITTSIIWIQINDLTQAPHVSYQAQAVQLKTVRNGFFSLRRGFENIPEWILNGHKGM